MDTGLLVEPQAREILLLLFGTNPDVVKTAMRTHEPSAVIMFAMRLAHSISSAWEVLPVKCEPNRNKAHARLWKFICARDVLGAAMGLLTLTPLERMSPDPTATAGSVQYALLVNISSFFRLSRFQDPALTPCARPTRLQKQMQSLFIPCPELGASHSNRRTAATGNEAQSRTFPSSSLRSLARVSTRPILALLPMGVQWRPGTINGSADSADLSASLLGNVPFIAIILGFKAAKLRFAFNGMTR